MSEQNKHIVRAAIVGAAGRMGRRLIALAAEDDTIEVVSAVESAACPHLGADAGELAGIGKSGIRVCTELAGNPDVVIDFSLPDGTRHWLAACVRAGLPFITGVTGFETDHETAFAQAAQKIPVLVAPNMSLGVNLLLRLVQETAGVLRGYDVEIVEAHHRFKRDAPSGTADALRQAVQAGSHPPRGEVIHGRKGKELSRPEAQIAIHAVRAGDIVGRHEVLFGGPGESLSFTHTAHSRDTFVRGALRAAKWIIGQPAGCYSMQDVLLR
jgi:4-hydroxy-tetrahydrodipicolinate reductase